MAIVCLFAVGAEGGTPPTAEQVNSALNLAEQAAQAGLTALSMQAVRRSLQSGPPVVSTRSDSIDIVFSGARVDTSRPLPVRPLDAVGERIPRVLSALLSKWENSAAPADIYETLRAIVLPEARSSEAFLYASPLRFDPLKPADIPAAKSLGHKLVAWARRAGELPDLQQRLALPGQTAAPQHALLAVLVAAEVSDEELLQRQSQLLAGLLRKGSDRETAELVASTGMSFLNHGRYLSAAAQLLDAAGVTLAAMRSADGRNDSPAARVLRAAVRGRFAVGDQDRAVELLKLYAAPDGRSGFAATAQTLDDGRREVIGRELYGRGLVAEAREILGSDVAALFERRYQSGILLSDRDKPDPGPPATVRSSDSVSIMRGAEVVDRDDVADRIWLCSLDPATRESTVLLVLPDFQSVSSPAVSPDGLTVAFDATRPGEAVTSGRQIYVAALDGSQIRSVGPGTQPVWSPAGRRLVCSRYSPSRGVWLLRSDGSEPQLIDGDGWAGRWSPDGRMIAYTKAFSQGTGLMIFDLAEDEYVPVLQRSGDQATRLSTSFCWSPDSQSVAFQTQPGRSATSDGAQPQSGPDILTSDIRGDTAPTQLVDGSRYTCSDIAWNPDGRSIVFSQFVTSQGTARLSSVSTSDPGEPIPLSGQFPARRNGGVSWLPDGKTLVYFSRPSKP